MDLSTTIAPKSDQLDAVDLVAGPRTFTVKAVTEGNAEQPVNIHFVEFDRPWRPSKSMRRVLVAAWGADGSQYVGRKVTLFCDPDVTFGGIKVGGTRISHMSHLTKPLSVALLVKRGKTEIYEVQPLTEPAPKLAANPALVTAIKQSGIGKDAFLKLAAETVGREIAASTDLTDDEAAKVIEALGALGVAE